MTNILFDESGQGLVEYALILSLIVLATVGALTQLAKPTNLPFTKIISFLH